MNEIHTSLLLRTGSLPACLHATCLGHCQKSRRGPGIIWKTLSYCFLMLPSNAHRTFIKNKNSWKFTASRLWVNRVFWEGCTTTFKSNLFRTHSSFWQCEREVPTCGVWDDQALYSILRPQGSFLPLWGSWLMDVTFPTTETLISLNVAVTDMTCSLPAVSLCELPLPNSKSLLHLPLLPPLLNFSSYSCWQQPICLSIAQ